MLNRVMDRDRRVLVEVKQYLGGNVRGRWFYVVRDKETSRTLFTTAMPGFVTREWAWEHAKMYFNCEGE